MENLFSNTLPIFLITLMGVIIKRKWLTSREFWRGLEKLSYFLLFPCVLFGHISSVDLKSTELMKLTTALIISTGIITVILIIYRKKTNSDKAMFTSVFQGVIRYNNYIFFGLGSALFGDEGLTIVSVIAAYMIVFTNILSVMIFVSYIPSGSVERSENSFKMILKLIGTNPLIISSICGFAVNYAGIELNLGVKSTIANLSSSAVAIGMLSVGAALNFTLSNMNFKQILFTSAMKLMIFPVITFLVLTLMSITGTAKSIGILYSCLPCASSSYVLSKQMGGDAESMASIITFSTMFSVISLSVLMYILG